MPSGGLPSGGAIVAQWLRFFGVAEDAITQNIEDQTNVQVESVSCPDDVDVEAGNTFECEIKLVNGKGATAELKILNEDADVKIVKLTGS